MCSLLCCAIVRSFGFYKKFNLKFLSGLKIHSSEQIIIVQVF